MTLAEIEARIRSTFPTLAYREAVLNTYGEDNYVVLLDGLWVVRMPRSDAQLGRFAAELRLLETLRDRVAVQVPHYEYVAEALGAYRLIEGREMTPPLYRSLPASRQREVLADLGAFLSVLHALPESAIAQTDGTVQQSWPPAMFAAYYRGMHREKIAAAVSASWLARFDAFHDAFEKTALGPARLVHGDLSDDHILLDAQGRMAGVIDFTDAGLGDAAIDFAYVWRLGESAVDMVLADYALATDDPGVKARARWTFVRYLINQIAYGDRAKWNLSVDQALAELEPHLKWCGV